MYIYIYIYVTICRSIDTIVVRLRCPSRGKTVGSTRCCIALGGIAEGEREGDRGVGVIRFVPESTSTVPPLASDARASVAPELAEMRHVGGIYRESSHNGTTP